MAAKKKATTSKSRSKKDINSKRESNKATHQVEKAMHDFKRGDLKIGKSGKSVTNRKQAVAIGLSEGRKKNNKKSGKK